MGGILQGKGIFFLIKQMFYLKVDYIRLAQDTFQLPKKPPAVRSFGNNVLVPPQANSDFFLLENNLNATFFFLRVSFFPIHFD